MEFNGTFFVTIITFIVFVFLMNKILYAPILNIMEERRRFIDGNYETAQKNNSRSEAMLAKKEQKLLEAKEEAKDKYNEIIDEFKTQKVQIVSEAQNIANDELEKSKIELENLSNEVKVGLRNSMTDLANDIVEKIIGYRSEISGFDEDAVNKVLWESK